jgi:phage/plasmid primase-like uncharacterized protein
MTFAELEHLAAGSGTTDVPCPVCGPTKRGASARRRVLRIWRPDDHFASFKCARCGIAGYERRNGSGAASIPAGKPYAPLRSQNELDEIKRKRRQAQAIWEASQPAAGTPVETYLRSRGITLPIPPVLTYHARLRHTPTGTAWPAMVALVQHGVTGKALAIHRTYLREDGTGKADVDPNKMMLGPVAGGAVQVAPLSDEIVIAEGIETALSIMQMTDKPVWAALSAGGIEALDMPLGVRRVILAADGDERGDDAVRKAGARLKAADPSRHISIARPPRGLDFNDVLLGRQEIAA